MKRFHLGRNVLNGTMLIRFSKPGKDALSSSNLDDFILHENMDIMQPLSLSQGNVVNGGFLSVTNSLAPKIPMMRFWAKGLSSGRQYFPSGLLYVQNAIAWNYSTLRFYNQTGESAAVKVALFARDFNNS